MCDVSSDACLGACVRFLLCDAQKGRRQIQLNYETQWRTVQLCAQLLCKYGTFSACAWSESAFHWSKNRRESPPAGRNCTAAVTDLLCRFTTLICLPVIYCLFLEDITWPYKIMVLLDKQSSCCSHGNMLIFRSMTLFYHPDLLSIIILSANTLTESVYHVHISRFCLFVSNIYSYRVPEKQSASCHLLNWLTMFTYSMYMYTSDSSNKILVWPFGRL